MDLDRSRVAELFPAWRVWAGVAGMCYASTHVGLSNVTLRGHNWDVLARRLELAEETLAARAAKPRRPGPSPDKEGLHGK